MEMTDRRSVDTSVKLRPSSYLTKIDGNCGGSSLCNDKSTLGNKIVGSRLLGISRMKRLYIVLYLIAALSFYYLVSKRGSVLDAEEVSHVVKKNLTDHIIFDDNSNSHKKPENEIPNFDEIDISPKDLPTTEETQNPKVEPTRPHVDKPNLKSFELNSSDETGHEKKEVVGKTNMTKNIEVDIKGSSLRNESYVKSQNEVKNETTNFPGSTPTITGTGQEKDFADIVNDDINNNAYKQNRTGDNPNTEYDTLSNGTASMIPLSSPSTQESNDFHEEPTKNSTRTNNVTITRTSNQLLKPLSDSDLSPVALNFARVHCDLTNLKDGAWYPSGPKDDWQQRAPYLIVAGVWNGGVNPLAKALSRHPQIDAAKKTDFFLPRNFGGKFSTTNNDKNSNQTTVLSTANAFKVKVFPARQRMQASHYSKATLLEKTVSNDEELTPTTADRDKSDDKNASKNQQVAIDVSPGLIFHAHETAHWILCTAPWVKVAVVLRNPIDRLYRQWSYSVNQLNLKQSLEDWMAPEMKLMQSVGMIDGGDEADNVPLSAEDDPKIVASEREAWRKYKSSRNNVKNVGAIGRSLYVFQLEEWIQAYISAGKIPSEEMIILTTEDIEEDTERKYSDLITFMGLTAYDNKPEKNGNSTADSISSTLKKALAQKTNTEPMSDETRTMLRKFFKPYNKRLTDLLTSNGFEGNWDERWT